MQAECLPVTHAQLHQDIHMTQFGHMSWFCMIPRKLHFVTPSAPVGAAVLVVGIGFGGQVNQGDLLLALQGVPRQHRF